METARSETLERLMLNTGDTKMTILNQISALLSNTDNPRRGMPGHAKTHGTYARTNGRLALGLVNELIEAERIEAERLGPGPRLREVTGPELEQALLETGFVRLIPETGRQSGEDVESFLGRHRALRAKLGKR
jgi:hypothetical protein